MTRRIFEAGSSARREAGFSLIELLVVLVLFGMMAAVVTPNVARGIQSAEFKRAVRESALLFRAARATAIRTQEPVVVGVDVQARLLSFGKDSDSVEFPAASALSVVSALHEVQSSTAAGISFYPDGSSTGGRLAASLENSSVAIAINWLTGSVVIEDE